MMRFFRYGPYREAQTGRDLGPNWKISILVFREARLTAPRSSIVRVKCYGKAGGSMASE